MVTIFKQVICDKNEFSAYQRKLLGAADSQPNKSELLKLKLTALWISFKIPLFYHFQAS